MTRKEKKSIRKAAINSSVKWELCYDATPVPQGEESYEAASLRWQPFEEAQCSLWFLCDKLGEKMADRSTATWMLFSERASIGFWKARNYAEKCRIKYQAKNRAAFAAQ